MRFRQQLPVSSPVRGNALLRALPAVGATGGVRHALRSALEAELATHFGASGVALTDSGTSALVLALRLAVPQGGTVAFPAYACVDLTAAALRAGVRVRLYDLDPATLSPDLDSIRQVLDRGVHAIVVAHLYGYPADLTSVAALCVERGVEVIEDAAQGAEGTLHGTVLGGSGPLSILSFGRGKGITGGHGGALLAIGDRWREAVLAARARLPEGGGGARALVQASAQWLLGRPHAYALPSAIPWLHLGEMIYHPAQEPRGLPAAAASLILAALAHAPSAARDRRRRARWLEGAAGSTAEFAPARVVSGGRSGYLRLAGIAANTSMQPASELGVVRGYPRTLFEQDQLRPALHADEREQPGALSLRRGLFTLPTHEWVTPHDLEALRRWMNSTEPLPNDTVASDYLVSQ